MEEPCSSFMHHLDPLGPVWNFSGWNGSFDYGLALGGREVVGALETGDHAHFSMKIFIGVSLGAIMLVCGLGNGLFVLTLSRLRSATGILVANLALSDLLVALLCCPFEMHYYVMRDLSWSFGPTMCSAVTYLRSVSLYVSTNVLTTIAVDRYLVIVHPLKPKMSLGKSYIITAAIWLMSLLVALPAACFSTQTTFDSFGRMPSHKVFCVQIWTADKATLYKSYFSFLLVVQFLVPVVAMGSCYWCICRALWFGGLPGNQTAQVLVQLRARRRTVLVLLAVLVTYVVCWTPYYSYAIIRDFFPERLLRVTHSVSLYYLVECIAMSNSVMNTLFFILARHKMSPYVWKVLVRRCWPWPCAHSFQRNTMELNSNVLKVSNRTE